MNGSEPSSNLRSRLVNYLLGGGRDPDPRFTLANERTFLAWIRTSLALLGGGIAVETFTADALEPFVRNLMSLSLLLLSAILSIGACSRWLHVERALRQQKTLPVPSLIPLLSLVTAIGAAVSFGLFWGR